MTLPVAFRNKNRVIQKNRICSLGFIFIIHLRIDCFTNKTIHAFPLLSSKISDQFAFAFWNDHIDSVVVLFVVAGGCFLLRVRIGQIDHML